MQQTSGSYKNDDFRSKLNPGSHTSPDQKFFDLKSKISKSISNYNEQIQKRFKITIDSAEKVYLINPVGAIAIIYKFLCSLELYTDDENFYLFSQIKYDMEQITKG